MMVQYNENLPAVELFFGKQTYCPVTSISITSNSLPTGVSLLDTGTGPRLVVKASFPCEWKGSPNMIRLTSLRPANSKFVNTRALDPILYAWENHV